MEFYTYIGISSSLDKYGMLFVLIPKLIHLVWFPFLLVRYSSMLTTRLHFTWKVLVLRSFSHSFIVAQQFSIMITGRWRCWCRLNGLTGSRYLSAVVILSRELSSFSEQVLTHLEFSIQDNLPLTGQVDPRIGENCSAGYVVKELILLLRTTLNTRLVFSANTYEQWLFGKNYLTCVSPW